MTHPHAPHGHVHDSHGHSHGHGHAHAPDNFNLAFAVGIAFNLAFVGVEGVYGILSHSLALIADAGHNLSDVLGLVVAWIGGVLSRRVPTARYTYGLRSSSVLAALANAVFLLVAVGAIAWEAVQRLSAPEPVAGQTIIVVALIGVAINAATALLFVKGRKADLNIEGAFLHMASDAVVSLGVVVAGVLILQTGWLWLDPAVTLVISFVILVGTWRLLSRSIALALDAVPAGIEPETVRRHLLGVAGVAAIHDLHIWALSTTETAMTCHLVMPAGHPGDAALMRIAEDVHRTFGIGHATLQVETGGEATCALEPDHVV
jgi:cobalt-zinc-cadmium efflux system protein